MPERIAAGICVALSLGAVALIVMNFVNNSLDDRRAALEKDLRAIVPFDTDYSVTGADNYGELRESIANKRAIWRELIKAPPRPAPKPRVIPPPDFKKLLKGVLIARQRIKKKGVVVKVKFTYATAPRRGAFHEVGDVIQNCAIISINENSVTFGLPEAWARGYDQGGKRYTHDLDM